MNKNISKEAYFERIRNLAEVNKTSLKESKSRTLGTLIDYKRAADGIAYGIIKEQHHYYIKKAGLKENPDVSDFAYIGGLSNITDYQYKKLSEADKQRNMLFNIINESSSFSKLNKSKPDNKKRLNEDKAGEEIDLAANKIDDLDAATDSAETPKSSPEVGGGDIPAEESPDSGEESSAELPFSNTNDKEEVSTEPSPEVGGGDIPAEESPNGDENVPAEESPDSGETLPSAEEKDITTTEIEKSLGKLANKIRKTEMTDSQIKSYVNSFLSAFKDKFDDVEIEDRKAMADKILKVVPDEDVEDVSASVPQDKIKETEMCAECGGFTQYAESRGYNKNTIKECDEEEISNLVSGYANAHNDGNNDGDFETIALFISPKIIDTLKNDYGHDEYTEKLTPYVNSLNECSIEEKEAKINELNWSNVDAGNVETQPNVVMEDGDEETITNEPEINNDEKEEISFAPDAQTLGVSTVKPETTPTTGVDVNVDAQNKTVNVTMNEEKKPSAGLSKEKKSEIVKKAKAGEDIGKKGKSFKDVEEKAKKSGASDPKAVAAAAMWKNIKRENVEKENPIMSESELKIRKYIRTRLEENAGLRKSNLNENKKSDKLKKLDAMIDQQYKLYENIVLSKKPEKINEIFGFSSKEKFEKLNPNDAASIEKLFNDTFSQALKAGARKQAASRMTTQMKYDLLKQGYDKDNLRNPSFGTSGGNFVYMPLQTENPFKSGGTGGKTSSGGV